MNPVPVPKHYRDTLDRFTLVLLCSPNFEGLPVTYVVTLDDMMESLKAGVAGVASRTKNPKALELFQKCIEEIDVTHRFFKEGKVRDGKLQIQVAATFFKKAGKLRNSKAVRVEDDLQPPPIQAG